ncbi:MAG: hypothetical protein HGB05_00820 [Chloroflexi bacterium]|nr:hypothetical protein [Chloroflexota bacterium]
MATVQPQYPQHVKGVEYFSLTTALKHFRQQVESGTGAPIQNIEINAALLLDDVCMFIGLSEEKRREVLGKSAASFVASVESEPVRLADKRH